MASDFKGPQTQINQQADSLTIPAPKDVCFPWVLFLLWPRRP